MISEQSAWTVHVPLCSTGLEIMALWVGTCPGSKPSRSLLCSWLVMHVPPHLGEWQSESIGQGLVGVAGVICLDGKTGHIHQQAAPLDPLRTISCSVHPPGKLQATMLQAEAQLCLRWVGMNVVAWKACSQESRTLSEEQTLLQGPAS